MNDVPFPTANEDHYIIDFHSEDLDFQLSNPPKIIAWIIQVCEKENIQISNLSFIFCSDNYLHDVNLEYLDHDTFTDIITFQYTQPPLVEGDIFISIDRVRENAITYKVSFEEELHRVIIHGVLHLCGYKDKTPENKKLMTLKENEALDLLKAS